MGGFIMYLDPLETRARETLVNQYGLGLIWQIERLDKHFFRAHLTDGRIVLAMLGEDGSATLREMEAVC